MRHIYKQQHMSKKFLTLVLVSSLAFASCSIDLSGNDTKNGKSGLSLSKLVKASDRTEKEVRKVQAFEGIDVSSAIKVEVLDGSATNVITIDAPDNILQYIKTEVKNNMLVVYIDRSISMNNSEVKISFPHQKIRNIKASGASVVKINGQHKVEDFKIGASGASVIKTSVIANTISIEGSGASSIEVSGNTQSLNIGISGASSFKGKALKAANVDVECSGASNATVWAVDQIKASGSGASSIRYINEPGLQVKKSVSGASSVKDISK